MCPVGAVSFRRCVVSRMEGSIHAQSQLRPTGGILVEGAAQPFSVGAQVHIEYVDDNGELLSFRTRIDDVTDQSLMLQLPYQKGVPVRFEPGSHVLILRQDDEQRISYAATVTVVETRPGTLPLLIVTKPTDYEVVPRRRFFRCPVRLPVQIGEVQGEATNLSGSGVLVVLPAQSEWKPGVEVNLALSLPGEREPLILNGRVVRVRNLPGGSRQAVAFDFVHLRERTQDTIIRYLFIRQRELIRQGLWDPEERPAPRRVSPGAG